MSLARFVEMWTVVEYPPRPVSQADLDTAERHFSIRLPDDYRQAVLQTGLPRPTIALLNTISERELSLHDLSDLYSPAEIIDQTTSSRRAGMPDHLLAIACDCMGNQFCFDVGDLGDAQEGDRPIWFFDHDFGTIDRIASSFRAWIDGLCEIEPVPWP